MNKKDLTFTIGLTIFMGILWIAGELIMGLVIPVRPWVYIAWRVGIVVVTLAISVWHSMIEDKSEKKTPRQAKYERKVGRKNK
ncbi:MAG: hypothetical protein IJX77_08870 [Ruminococcus sp.]|nr:hypothetical protein [Ruminococcus sp.]